MKTRYLTFFAALLLGVSVVRAQTSADVLRFSQYNYGFGTARSAAMGGAFASLGADMSAAALNPAGFGMYLGSEFAVSPSLTIHSVKSSFSGDNFSSSVSDDRTVFALNTVGAAMNVYRGTGALTGVTAAVTYTKLADFNSRAGTYGRSSWSMADIFVDRLNGYSPAIPPSALEAPSDDVYRAFRNYPTGLWNSIMAYQSYLLDYNGSQYTLEGLLSPGAVSRPDLRHSARGSIGEYGFSGGFNFSNLIYFGLSLGVQDIYYRDRTDFSETYTDNSGSLTSFNLGQQLRMTASAVNVKFGLIAMPVEGLRIGAAFHTPTYINVSEEYSADMVTHIAGEQPGGSDTPYLLNDYKMRTPMRLILGASYQFGATGILSVDYERVWYDKMKMKSSEDRLLEGDIDREVSDRYKAADNFRIGAEAVIYPQFYLRAGYAFYGSMFKHKETSDQGMTQNISGGIGYRTGFFFADLAYIYMRSDYQPYRFYDFTSPIDGAHIATGDVNTRSTRHNITLTMGVRF